MKLLAFAAALLILPEAAHGEASAIPSEGASSEIVVTARKREERLRDVPLAVSAIRGGDIARADLRSAAELTASVPNLLTPLNPVLFNGPTFFIRGVGQGDHNWNTENGVAVFLDDVYLQSTNAAWVDLVDMERIEVLRGPQGTLYGRNSTSGAIKFVPRRPDPGASRAYAETTLGSRARFDAKAGLNLPLADGAAAVKLDLYRTATDGYFTLVDTAGSPLDDKLSRRENYGVRLATLWRPAGGLEFELNTDITRQNAGMHIPTPIVPAPPAVRSDLSALLSKRGTVRFVPLFGVNRGALEPLSVGGDTGHTDGGVVFKAALDSGIGRMRSITAWRGYHEHWESQLGGRGTPTTIFPPGITLYGNVETRFERVGQFSQELQLTGSLGPTLDYTAGAYYFHDSWKESEYGATTGIPANLSPFRMSGQTQPFGGSIIDVDQTAQSWALYANVDWHVTPNLTATIGGRQTWDRKHLLYDALFEDHVHHYPDFPIDTRHSWSRFTPRAALDWRPTGGLLVYASYARGYKVGNVEGARSVIASAAGHWLAPELATTWEGGAKAEWFGGRLTTNVALFASDYTGRTDLISPDFVASSNVRSRGIEAELTAIPAEGLRLYVDLGLLWARFRNASANHPIFAPDPSGFAPGYAAHPPMTPRYTMNAGGEYRFAASQIGTFIAEASARAVGRHFHSLGIANFDSEIVKAYAVADASLSRTDRANRLRFTVGVHNLFDTTYWYSGLFGPLPEFDGRYYADGRTWYVRARWEM